MGYIAYLLRYRQKQDSPLILNGRFLKHAYVPYTSKILVAIKGLDFFPEIARSGHHKLIQYNRVGSSGLNCRETAKMSISH